MKKKPKTTRGLFPNSLPGNTALWVLTALAAGMMAGIGQEVGKAILKETGRTVEKKADISVPKELKE